MRSHSWYAQIGLAMFALTSCTVNIGTNEPVDNSVAVDSSTTASSEVAAIDPEELWDVLAANENSLSQSEVAFTGNGMFGLLAVPELRLYKFSGGSWIDIAGDDLTSLNPLSNIGLDPSSVDYEVTIQSVDLTGDGSVEFIIGFRPAPWDSINAPNQGRRFGSVLSCDEGNCRSLPFWEPIDYAAGGTDHLTVEYIEWIEGTLFASWYGTCGRPCGMLIYEWVPAYDRFEGTEATDRQRKETERLNCIEFRYSLKLPITLCDKGTPVEMVQNKLQEFSYDFDVDGYFGVDTRLAVKLFQKAQGIPVTGEVDKDTWAAIFDGIIIPGYDLNNDGLITPEEFPGD